MFKIDKFNEIDQIIKNKQIPCEIVAISKNHAQESVLFAINHGVRIFGENRVMEAKQKFEQLKKQNKDLELHLTGPLQSNKVKEAVNLFDVFHTLDREKIAREFSKYPNELKNKKIFIQVNTGEETTKSGIFPRDLRNFTHYCKDTLKLNIVGLMCIPPIKDDPNRHFLILQRLASDNKLSELSIGMSNDYIIALEYSPTYIRLGTILFGTRD